MTYVKTQEAPFDLFSLLSDLCEDKTKESGDWEHERHEWFVMYLSNQAVVRNRR